MTTPIDAKQMMMLLTPIATLTGYASSVESGANTTRWSESLLKHGKEAEVALDKLMDIFLGMMDAESAKAPPVPAAHEGLREVLEFYAEAWTFKTNERYGGLEWSPMERLLDDCGNRAKDAIATLDAIITVQALNMSADHVQKPGNIEHVNTHQPDELSRTIECILFQHFSNCLAGTDFKDDPKKQKYMDAAKEVMRYVAKQPAREIVEDDKLIDALMNEHDMDVPDNLLAAPEHPHFKAHRNGVKAMVRFLNKHGYRKFR